MEESFKQLYEFGPFRLHPAERLLLLDGQAISLAPKVFDTLLVLVQNSGHLLEKDELLRLIWPDTFVEEGSLTKNVFVLRKILEEGQGGKEYIETIPKRGYRFVAEVKKPNGIEAKPVVEPSMTPLGAREMQPTALSVSPTVSRANRSKILLSVLAFLVPLSSASDSGCTSGWRTALRLSSLSSREGSTRPSGRKMRSGRASNTSIEPLRWTRTRPQPTPDWLAPGCSFRTCIFPPAKRCPKQRQQP